MTTQNQRIRITGRQLLSAAWARLENVAFDYQRSDGQWQPLQREIYHRGHGAAILLYDTGRRTVVLVRQFRLPVHLDGGEGFMLEVPAGVVDPDDAAEGARREAIEETGFSVEAPDYVFTAYVSPGSVTEKLYYYTAPYQTAQRLHAGGGLVEEGEDIEVLEVNIDQAMAWVGSGEIVDAKTILLLQHARLNLFA